MDKLKLELSWKHFFLNLAQMGISLGVWMTMLDYPAYVWGFLAVAGNVLASFDRADTGLAQLKKLVELSAWAVALLTTPTEISGWLYPGLAVFNFMELIVAGLVQSREGSRRSVESEAEMPAREQESSSPGFLRRIIPFARG